jgi:hypothetical protein
MKTFVLHPDDRSTDFLKEIYRGKAWTVCTRWEFSKNYFMAMIECHDRIIMMGHGSPHGLLGFGYLFMNPDIIKLLQTKQCICIWCNADKYVIPNNLKGFYTGMFISEVSEARYFGINVSQDTINRSNDLFAFEMRLCLDHDDPKDICEEVKSTYVGSTEVYKFNNDRLYYRDETSPVLPDDSSKELLIY